MLFSKNKILLFFSGNFFEWFNSEKIEIQKTAYFAQEIIDQKEFEKEIDGFFQKAKLENQQIIFVLGKQNYFSQIIQLNKDIKEQELVERYFSQIPLNPRQIQRMVIKGKNSLALFAVNKKIIETLTTLLSHYGATVVATIPIEPFGGENTLSTEVGKGILKNQNKVYDYNFIIKQEKSEELPKEKTEEKIEEEEDTMPVYFKQYFFFFLAILFLIAMILYALISFKVIPSPFEQGQNNTKILPQLITPTVAISPTTSPTPSIQLKSKKDITVSVLNDTGIAGQAGKIKDLLTTNQFANITTDSMGTGNTITKITYSPFVSQETKDELQNLLQSTFQQIQIAEDDSQKTDIIIITGAEK